MKRINFISLLGGCLALVIMVTGCITIVTQPEPTPTNMPLPTNTPMPTPTPQPVVIVSGYFDLPQTYMADLDTGIVPKDPKDSVYNEVDLWFEAVTPQERYLEPYNGASWAVVGPNAIGFNDCKNFNPTPARVDIRNLPSGTYICVATNAKNISVIRINSINYASRGMIRIEFTTWRGQ